MQIFGVVTKCSHQWKTYLIWGRLDRDGTWNPLLVVLLESTDHCWHFQIPDWNVSVHVWFLALLVGRNKQTRTYSGRHGAPCSCWWVVGRKTSPATFPLVFRATCCLCKSRGAEESDCGETDQEASGDPSQPWVSILLYYYDAFVRCCLVLLWWPVNSL